MPLNEYRRKRNFEKTPEPFPDTQSLAKDGQFFVQRHDASRLHYDFRLAIDGVLKSWAVPKGPSMDPAHRRLAMEVEDHPLAYGSFEGNIPKGEYGGGSVMLWDRGEFLIDGRESAQKQWERGDLKLELKGQKLRGAFKLFRMRGKTKGTEWLLVKAKDAFATPGWTADELAASVLTNRTQREIAEEISANFTNATQATEPMLPTLVKTLPEGDSWLYEVKWDGVRVLCTVSDGSVDLRSRNGTSYNRSFPELMDLPQWLKLESGVLDGEIVAMDAEGRIHFGAIQPRLGGNRRGGNRRGGAGPEPEGISLYLFDLLFRNGKDLRSLPLEKRRAALARVLQKNGRVQLSPALQGSATSVMEVAAEGALEGIVAKRRDSPYRPGRSTDWVKVKLERREDFVICGWLPGKRKSFASLVLGLFDNEGLSWCGNVGTGFSEAELHSLSAMLKKSVKADGPAFAYGPWPSGMRWVEPALVAELRFAEWTQSGRLRSPVFLGLRPDKQPADCVREEAELLSTPRTLAPSVQAEEPTNAVARKRARKRSAAKSSPRPAISHGEKLYFPDDKITKGQLIAYYEEVAPYLVPHLQGRPAVLKRFPDGIDGKFFFQKNLPASTPSWVPTVTLPSEHERREIRYIVIDDVNVLLYAVNLGCIEMNAWMSRTESIDSPDYILFDLDPFECGFAKVVETAHVLRETLAHLGLDAYVKTSGGDGLHVVTPLAEGHTYSEVKSFTEGMASAIGTMRPDLVTTERSIKKRPVGKVYFDYLQFGKGKTIASIYSVRPRKGAPVSMPLQWDELTAKTRPTSFHLRNTLSRLRKKGDLWEPVLRKGHVLQEALDKLQGL